MLGGLRLREAVSFPVSGFSGWVSPVSSCFGLSRSGISNKFRLCFGDSSEDFKGSGSCGRVQGVGHVWYGLKSGGSSEVLAQGRKRRGSGEGACSNLESVFGFGVLQWGFRVHGWTRAQDSGVLSWRADVVWASGVVGFGP